MADEEVGGEESRLADDGVGDADEPVAVARKVVVFPKLRCEPWAGHWVVVPRHVAGVEGSGEAENVGGHFSGPASRAVVGGGCAASRLDD